jgi:hypothetical protein
MILTIIITYELKYKILIFLFKSIFFNFIHFYILFYFIYI